MLRVTLTLFDDRAVNYEAWNQVQTAVRQLANGGGMTMNGIELPPPDEGGGGGELTNSYESLVFGTNDLWIELNPTGLTNGTANLLLHVPEFYTNAVWDVFATTNLNLDFPGLNGTNWTWVTRTESGVTNLTVRLLSDYQTYYRIANTNDLDGDGLTDAFEALVSHSSETTNDTDGDGMFDGWEWLHGLNLNDTVDASDDPDGDWLTNLQEYNGGTNSTDPHNSMVLAWGLNHSGQLLALQNLRGVVALAGGYDFSLALQSDGTVRSWGYSTNVLSGVTNAVQIAAKAYHAIALKSDGTIETWGDWWPSSDVFYPTDVPAGISNIVAVATGADHDMALHADGTVTAWGFYYNAPYSPLPTNLPSAKGIAAGWEHSAILLTNGSVLAFGPTLYSITNVPTGLNDAVQISAGAYHTLALRADGTVMAWGAGTNNSGTAFNYGQSMVPSGLSSVIAVSATSFGSLALRSDGTVVVWGSYATGQFPYAAAMSLLQEPVLAIGSGDEHALALRSGRLLPLLTKQPTNIITLPGATATFAASAIGLSGVHYQWRLNGTNLLGATNSTLTINSAQASDLGNYTATISTGAGSITTSNATLAFLQPPTILSTTPTAPGSFVVSNLSFSLSVVASTAPGFTNYYQWYQGGILISNATATNYAVSWGQVGEFTVKIWNVVGTNTSAAWTISNPSNMVSLHDALTAEWASRTNAGRGYELGWHWVWQNADAVGDSSPVWNTNSILFKDSTLATGATAIEYWNEASLPAGNAGVMRFTMLTKRIGVTAGHYFDPSRHYLTNPFTTSSNLVFIGRTNAKHRLPVQAIVGGRTDWTLMGGGTNAIEDRAYVLLSNNIPDDVEVMRIATPFATRTDLSGGVVADYVWAPYVAPTWGQEAFPGFTVCQHFCVGRNNADTHYEYTDGTPIGFHAPGDSGSPAFIILSNECLYTGGWTYEQSSGDMVKAVQVINAWAGLDTNSAANQLQFYSLTNFPSW